MVISCPSPTGWVGRVGQFEVAPQGVVRTANSGDVCWEACSHDFGAVKVRLTREQLSPPSEPCARLGLSMQRGSWPLVWQGAGSAAFGREIRHQWG